MNEQPVQEQRSQNRSVVAHGDDNESTESRMSGEEIKEPPKTNERAWYRDPPKIVGVLGFILALGTLGERFWVREQEQTLQRLQQLREVTSGLADIQSEYLEALADGPSNIYALGVAKNTKRQMYLQTAAALLSYPAVKQQASAQIFAALGGEAMSDGRYEAAKTYFDAALNAPGADEATRPYLLRSLGLLYRIPNTQFAHINTARDYFGQARKLLEKRLDDTGHLAWAETVLTEASLEVTYDDRVRAKALASQAIERIKKVRSLSPLRTQLEHLAAAYERGEQYSQTMDGTLQQPPATQDASLQQSHSVPAVRDESESGAAIEIWDPIAGQLSGAEMEVSIDGKVVGHLSNLSAKRHLDLPGLSSGVHKFTFTNLKAYFIDPAKGPSMTGGGFSCAGLFELVPQKGILKVNVGSGPNGMMCTLQ